MPDEIADLLERVRKATGPFVPGQDCTVDEMDRWARAIFGPTFTHVDWGLLRDALVEGSLDAALALVERVKGAEAIPKIIEAALVLLFDVAAKHWRISFPLAILAALLASMKETSDGQ